MSARIVHSPVLQPGSNMCVCGSPANHVVHGLGVDAAPDTVLGDLRGALERLCRAQVQLPSWWRADAQQAIAIVQMIGSAVCPGQWSKHDQPEYPEATS